MTLTESVIYLGICIAAAIFLLPMLSYACAKMATKAYFDHVEEVRKNVRESDLFKRDENGE